MQRRWDSIMYEAARMEKNITLLLNCSCMDAEMSGGVIASITWTGAQCAPLQ